MEDDGTPPKRKAGRPRKHNPAIAISEVLYLIIRSQSRSLITTQHRRAQIRNAQKTYRINRNARERELEERLKHTEAKR